MLPTHRGLPLGSKAPAFSLVGLHGETMTLDALRAADRPVLLLFMDPGCGPCNALLPEVGRWQREQAAQLTLAIVTRGTAEANRAKSAEHGIAHVLLQHDREVSTAYQAHGTPSMVLVRPDGTIGSAVASGPEAIQALVTAWREPRWAERTPASARPDPADRRTIQWQMSELRP